MNVSVGDRIVVESERAAQSGHAGVIEEVLSEDPQRFRVLVGRRTHEHLRSLGWRREDRAAQDRARQVLTPARGGQAGKKILVVSVM